jgi:putative heme transporter
MREATTPLELPHAVPRRIGARSLVVRLTLLAAIAGTAVVFRDRLPDPAAIAAMARQAEAGWLALVVAAEILSMGAFARLQRRLLLTGGVRLSRRRAFAVTYAGNALSTTLPAGPAVSVVYAYRQWRRSGASAQLATAVILLGGIATTTAYTVIGLLALLGEPRSRLPAAATLTVALAALLVVWQVPGSRRALRRLGRTALRAALRNRRTAPLARSLRRARGVVRFGRRDWGAVVALSTLNWVFEILALVAAGRALDVQVTPHQIMLAYFAAQAAGSLLPLLPGGFGAIEGSLVAVLVAFGATAVPAAAAVAVYRLVSFWAVVAVGWLAWLALRASDQAQAARARLGTAGRAPAQA